MTEESLFPFTEKDVTEMLASDIMLMRNAPQISEFDQQNVGEIIGGQGDWFSAHLLRLMHVSDRDNFYRLSVMYPHHAGAYESWKAKRDYGDETFELAGKKVRLGGLFSDPDRGIVIDGAEAYVEGYIDQITGKPFIELLMDGNVTAVLAAKRFRAIERSPGLFQIGENDRMVGIQINGLSHIVSEEEFGDLGPAYVEVLDE